MPVVAAMVLALTLASATVFAASPPRRAGLTLAAVRGVVPSGPAPTASIPYPTALPLPLTSHFTAPVQPGWLYVLDVLRSSTQSQILVVDPATQRVMGSIYAGAGPDMALSPDGTRLYVASSRGAGSELAAIDTRTGAIVHTTPTLFRAEFTLRPFWSNLAISPDGQRLYVQTLQTIGPGQDLPGVATFDTVHGRFLPDTAEVPGCGLGQAVSEPAGWDLAVQCLATHDLRFLRLAPSGAVAAEHTVALPVGTSGGSDLAEPAGSALAPDRRTVAVITLGGRAIIVDAASGQILQAADLGVAPGRWVPQGMLALSPDGARLYLGVGRLDERSQHVADQIVVIDPHTWRRVGTITPPQPLWGLATDRNGGRLYALDPDGHRVHVIDAGTLRDISTMTSVGAAPVRAIVAP